jgi:hypothetical protein
MPAKASLFNQKAELVFDYGSGPKAGGTFKRDGEYISKRGPTIGGFVIVLTKRSMHDITVPRLRYRVQEYRLPSHTSIKCNVLCESLIEDRQNIPCATRVPGVISIFLWVHLYKCRAGMGAVCDVVWIRMQSRETSWSNNKYKNKCTNGLAFPCKFYHFLSERRPKLSQRGSGPYLRASFQCEADSGLGSNCRISKIKTQLKHLDLDTVHLHQVK